MDVFILVLSYMNFNLFFTLNTYQEWLLVVVICRLQGVNTLVVALASHGITLLSSLLEELQVEGLITEAEDEQISIGADFSVNSPCSAWRRVKKLMDDLPLLNYLLAQFSTLYRMVGITFSVSTFDITQHTTFKFLNWSIGLLCIIITIESLNHQDSNSNGDIIKIINLSFSLRIYNSYFIWLNWSNVHVGDFSWS